MRRSGNAETAWRHIGDRTFGGDLAQRLCYAGFEARVMPDVSPVQDAAMAPIDPRERSGLGEGGMPIAVMPMPTSEALDLLGLPSGGADTVAQALDAMRPGRFLRTLTRAGVSLPFDWPDGSGLGLKGANARVAGRCPVGLARRVRLRSIREARPCTDYAAMISSWQPDQPGLHDPAAAKAMLMPSCLAGPDGLRDAALVAAEWAYGPILLDRRAGLACARPMPGMDGIRMMRYDGPWPVSLRSLCMGARQQGSAGTGAVQDAVQGILTWLTTVVFAGKTACGDVLDAYRLWKLPRAARMAADTQETDECTNRDLYDGRTRTEYGPDWGWPPGWWSPLADHDHPADMTEERFGALWRWAMDAAIPARTPVDMRTAAAIGLLARQPFKALAKALPIARSIVAAAAGLPMPALGRMSVLTVEDMVSRRTMMALDDVLVDPWWEEALRPAVRAAAEAEARDGGDGVLVRLMASAVDLVRAPRGVEMNIGWASVGGHDGPIVWKDGAVTLPDGTEAGIGVTPGMDGEELAGRIIEAAGTDNERSA